MLLNSSAGVSRRVASGFTQGIVEGRDKGIMLGDDGITQLRGRWCAGVREICRLLETNIDLLLTNNDKMCKIIHYCGH